MAPVVARVALVHLIYSLRGVFSVKVANAQFVEVFLLDQRQVCVAFHLGKRLLTWRELLCCVSNELFLVHCSDRWWLLCILNLLLLYHWVWLLHEKVLSTWRRALR